MGPRGGGLPAPAPPSAPNRHFHTFDTPEGRLALKVFRRLRSLRNDILACQAEGRRARISRQLSPAGDYRIELLMDRLSGRRVSMLQAAEFELLADLPGVRDALEILDVAA